MTRIDNHVVRVRCEIYFYVDTFEILSMLP
jgi:hypothetical protein